MKSPSTVLSFFWSKISIHVRLIDGIERHCWLWTGAKTRGGDDGRWQHTNRYGSMRAEDGRTVRVHRWAFLKFRGPIPSNRDLDHAICDDSLCVNPWHTEPTPKPINTRRRNWKHNPNSLSGRKWTSAA